MNNTVIKILETHTELLRQADKANVDILKQVVETLIKKLSIHSNEFRYYDRYKQDYGFSPNPTLKEVEVGQKQGKLDAIKIYKDRTGLSLMDSKRGIENYFDVMGFKFAGQK